MPLTITTMLLQGVIRAIAHICSSSGKELVYLRELFLLSKNPALISGDVFILAKIRKLWPIIITSEQILNNNPAKLCGISPHT